MINITDAMQLKLNSNWQPTLSYTVNSLLPTVHSLSMPPTLCIQSTYPRTAINNPLYAML